jgi:hypothetical protein
MSVDLTIIPTIEQPLKWESLLKHWRSFLTYEQNELLGQNPALFHLGTHERLEDNATLAVNAHYYPKLTIPNTLSLSLNSNQSIGVADREDEYLRGSNLSEDSIQKISHQWKSIGYSFNVDSMGGRGVHESHLMIGLVKAITLMCEGYVVVDSDAFAIGEGIYTLDQFMNIQPKF